MKIQHTYKNKPKCLQSEDQPLPIIFALFPLWDFEMKREKTQMKIKENNKKYDLESITQSHFYS